MKVSLFLADAAQADAQSGNVNALGLGWRQCQTPTPAFALVLFLDIDWDETNKQHRLKCQLLTTDGEPVTVPGRRGLSGFCLKRLPRPAGPLGRSTALRCECHSP